MKNKSIWFILMMIVIILSFYSYKVRTFKPENPSLQELSERIDFSIKQNRLDNAIIFLKQALELYPQEDRFHYLLACLFFVQENFLEAHKHISILIQKKPSSEYILLQGRIYEKQKEIAKATEIFLQLQKQKYLPAYLALAKIYINEYEIVKAKELLEEWSSLNEEPVAYRDILLLKAEVAMLEADYPLVEEFVKEFIHYRPYIPEAHILFIRSLSLQGKLQEAREYYAPFLENKKRANYSFYELIYGNVLSPQEAVTHYQNIPNISPVRNIYLLESLIEISKFEEAILKGEDFIKLESSSFYNPQIISLLGKAYLHKKEFAKAEKTFSLLKNNNSSQLYTKELVTSKIFEKKFEEAESICTKALADTLNKKHRLRLQMLSNEVNYYKGNFLVVIESSNHLLETMSPGMSEYSIALNLIAHCYLAQKKYDEAASYFSKIYTEKTSVPKIILLSRVWHGVSLYLSGKKIEAMEIWHNTKEISWDKHLADTRTLYFISLLTKGEINEILYSVPSIENDIELFQGIYWQSNKDHDKAHASFQKGLEKSFYGELPYYVLQNLISTEK